MSLHNVTGCGIAIDEATARIASGDFEGNVFVWDPMDDHHQRKENFGMSVRCLAWTSHACVMVGCVDGSLTCWDTDKNMV